LASQCGLPSELWLSQEADYTGPLPADLFTMSGSGLDPHISPASAMAQVDRVANARGLSVEQIKSLIDAHTEGRDLGFFGEPRANVLNMDLDRQFPASASLLS
jgi:potassium-transporting ATPase KdpC subunit